MVTAENPLGGACKASTDLLASQIDDLPQEKLQSSFPRLAASAAAELTTGIRFCVGTARRTVSQASAPTSPTFLCPPSLKSPCMCNSKVCESAPGRDNASSQLLTRAVTAIADAHRAAAHGTKPSRRSLELLQHCNSRRTSRPDRSGPVARLPVMLSYTW